MSPSAVTWRLDCHEEEVLSLVEEGCLLWAFNIAAPKAKKVACLRILAESVEDFAVGRQRSYGDDEAEWLRVAGIIFPQKCEIDTYELARALNCGRQHAMDLIHARQFRLAPGAHIRRGPGGSPQILTASVAEWLKERRVF
ncbi:MAG: hypothetical protein ABSG59_24785 [Verrucomicrobiota bacterium]|jgi:hypothetical protein